MTNVVVNCTGTRRRDEGCNHHSGKLHGWLTQGPGMGPDCNGNVPNGDLLSVRFLFISHIDIQVPIVMTLNADNTRETNVLWQRYSTLENQFYHEVHHPFFYTCLLFVFEMFKEMFRVFDMFQKFGQCL